MQVGACELPTEIQKQASALVLGDTDNARRKFQIMSKPQDIRRRRPKDAEFSFRSNDEASLPFFHGLSLKDFFDTSE